MKLICKLIGHNMRQETQFTDKSDKKHDDGFESHTRINTVYFCTRCCYVFSNTINLGKFSEESVE